MQRINPSFAATLRMTILFAVGAAGCTTYAELTLGSGGSGSQDASTGAGGSEDPPTGSGGSGGTGAGSGGSGATTVGSGGSGAATTGSGGSAGMTTGAGGSSGTTTGSGGSSGTTTGSGGSAGTSTDRDGSSEASAGSGGSSGATGSGGAAGTSTGSGGSGGGSAGSGGFAGTSTGSDGSAGASADSGGGGGGGVADASGGKDRGDAGGPFSPLCSDVPLTTAGEVPTKGGTCTTTDTQLCYKTCGPLSLGFKSETCMGGVYVEQSNCSFPDGDYSCYRIPPVISPACPTTTPQATQACTVAECVLCNVAGDYLDSTGAMKMGYCVCPAGGDSATRKWSCASTTSWPCPDGDGC